MTATVETTVTAGRVRWYHRRPPAMFDRFQRGVWWAGHAQLYIAWVFAVVGPAMFITSQLAAEFLTFYGSLAMVSVLFIGAAAPFWLSGRLLRWYAQVADGRHRVIWLTGAILAIAVVSIIATFVCIFVFMFGFGTISPIVSSALSLI